MSYSCPNCHYNHDGKKIVTERVDQDTPAKFCFCSSCSHGWFTYRVCPKCGYKDTIKWKDDLNHPHNKEKKITDKVREYRKTIEQESEKSIKELESKIERIKQKNEQKIFDYCESLKGD